MRVRARLGSGRRLDRLHHHILGAMEVAVQAVSPTVLIRRHLKIDHGMLRVDDLSLPLDSFRKIWVIGAGKASGGMAEAIEQLLGSRVSGGLVVLPNYLRPWPRSRRIVITRGTHPTPSEHNVRNAMRMLELIDEASRRDLVIVLISGGSSALMEYPMAGIRLADLSRTTDMLLESGARVEEINAVRKHLSRLKGGRLAEKLGEPQVLTLIISDVVGDRLDAIGSGPTAPDPTTYREAKKVLEKYNLWRNIPAPVSALIERGIGGIIAETPKDPRTFKRVKNVIVGNNRQSCLAAASHLKKMGYDAHVLSTSLVGEAKAVGRILGSITLDIRDSGLLSSPAVLISGGETTVTVNGRGKGGRNQELALAAAIMLDQSRGLVFGSLGTDGVDGPTNAAGAMVDGTTVARGHKRGLDPEKCLENNDSYTYFSAVGDLVRTGPTGTNVNDLMFMAAG